MMMTPMKGMFWNCRGLKKRGLDSYVRDLVRDLKLDIVCLAHSRNSNIVK
jgi:hypothetical protein